MTALCFFVLLDIAVRALEIKIQLRDIHKWCPIFCLFFDLPTYPCPILSYHKHSILVYSVRFWQTYLPTQKLDILSGCPLIDKVSLEIKFGKIYFNQWNCYWHQIHYWRLERYIIFGGIQKGYPIFGYVGRFSKIGYYYAKAVITLG